MCHVWELQLDKKPFLSLPLAFKVAECAVQHDQSPKSKQTAQSTRGSWGACVNKGVDRVYRNHKDWCNTRKRRSTRRDERRISRKKESSTQGCFWTKQGPPIEDIAILKWHQKEGARSPQFLDRVAHYPSSKRNQPERRSTNKIIQISPLGREQGGEGQAKRG